MKVLTVGDIVARPGRKVLIDKLGRIQANYNIDFTVVNIENAAGGFGITEKILNQFQTLRIDVMTSGNHIWDKSEALIFIDKYPDLLRPHNYPVGTPGTGWHIKKMSNGARIGVLNLMGQAFMNPTLDSPFTLAD
ncbi:MAG: YmdB family metallophosphoesterase, partial [bacterium]